MTSCNIYVKIVKLLIENVLHMDVGDTIRYVCAIHLYAMYNYTIVRSKTHKTLAQTIALHQREK